MPQDTPLSDVPQAVFKNGRRAKHLLAALLEQLGHVAGGKKEDLVSAFSLKRGALNEGKEEAYWRSNPKQRNEGMGARRQAYALFYWIASRGGRTFFGTGIPMGKERLYPDKGVIKACLESGHLSLDPKGQFILTDTGVQWIEEIAQSIDWKSLVQEFPELTFEA